MLYPLYTFASQKKSELKGWVLYMHCWVQTYLYINQASVYQANKAILVIMN